MHYKNGREAKNGDPVMLIPAPEYGGKPVVGILYNAQAGNDYCNGRIALTLPGDPCPNLKEVLHLEDAMALLNPPKATIPEPALESKPQGDGAAPVAEENPPPAPTPEPAVEAPAQ